MNKKCCKSCCECICHKDDNVDCCWDGKCKCQREFKKGDWVKRRDNNMLRFVLGFDSKAISNLNLFIPYNMTQGWFADKYYKLHTLTADDLIPCPYCKSEMAVRGNNVSGWYCCCSSPHKGSFWCLPTRETVHEAVAYLLLLKMREDHCDF